MTIIGYTMIGLTVIGMSYLNCSVTQYFWRWHAYRWYGCFCMIIGSAGTVFLGLTYDVTLICCMSIYTAFICLWLSRVYFCGTISWSVLHKKNERWCTILCFDVRNYRLSRLHSHYPSKYTSSYYDTDGYHLHCMHWKWHSLLLNRLYIFTCWFFAFLFFFRNRWWNPDANPYVCLYVHV